MLLELLRKLTSAFPDFESANRKGMRLLRENLTPMQRNQHEERRSFEVVGGQTGRHYRIRHGDCMNIDELNSDGDLVNKWCVVPCARLVIGDILLAQKVALETFEAEALAIARKYPRASAPLTYRSNAAPPVIGWES